MGGKKIAFFERLDSSELAQVEHPGKKFYFNQRLNLIAHTHNELSDLFRCRMKKATKRGFEPHSDEYIRPESDQYPDWKTLSQLRVMIRRGGTG